MVAITTLPGGTNRNIEHTTAYIKRLQQFIRHCDKVNYGNVDIKKQHRRREMPTPRVGQINYHETSSDQSGLEYGGDLSCSSHNDSNTGIHRRSWQSESSYISQARHRKKKGTLVMRGSHKENNEDECGQRKLQGRGYESDYDKSTTSMMAQESRDPPSTMAGF